MISLDFLDRKISWTVKSESVPFETSTRGVGHGEFKLSSELDDYFVVPTEETHDLISSIDNTKIQVKQIISLDGKQKIEVRPGGSCHVKMSEFRRLTDSLILCDPANHHFLGKIDSGSAPKNLINELSDVFPYSFPEIIKRCFSDPSDIIKEDYTAFVSPDWFFITERRNLKKYLKFNRITQNKPRYKFESSNDS